MLPADKNLVRMISWSLVNARPRTDINRLEKMGTLSMDTNDNPCTQ